MMDGADLVCPIKRLLALPSQEMMMGAVLSGRHWALRPPLLKMIEDGRRPVDDGWLKNDSSQHSNRDGEQQAATKGSSPRPHRKRGWAQSLVIYMYIYRVPRPALRVDGGWAQTRGMRHAARKNSLPRSSMARASSTSQSEEHDGKENGVVSLKRSVREDNYARLSVWRSGVPL